MSDDRDLRARNRETVERYVRLTGEERLNRWRLFTPDGSGGLRTTDSGEPIAAVGREALAEADAWNYRYFEDWTYSEIEVFETQDPNRFWVECVGTGWITFPAYERARYTNRYLHYFLMEDGLIKQYWEYMNPCAEMHALGIEVPSVQRPSFVGADA